MKKLLMALSLMLGFTAFVTAQTPKAKTTAKPAVVKPVAAPAKVVTMEKTSAKPVAVTPATVAVKPVAKTTTAKPVKADGSPDMRFKANQNAAKPVVGPKKADGTPDMRYKENKKAKG